MTPTITAFGPGARLHHVGMAVASIAEHAPEATITHDPRQRVRVAFVTLAGTCIELIEPAGGGSPIARSLEKGTKIVHLCYQVDDLESALAVAATHGFRRLQAPVPAPAFDGRRIAWCISATYGLVELLEAQPRGAEHRDAEHDAPPRASS